MKSDNGRDHRGGTSDRPLQKHAQVRLRVHHIVQVSRYRGEALGLDCSKQISAVQDFIWHTHGESKVEPMQFCFVCLFD